SRRSSRFISGHKMNRSISSFRAALGAAAIALAIPSPATAQQLRVPIPAKTEIALPPVVSSAAKVESVTVAAGRRYRAGALHRWFVGGTYRDLWTMPIHVPVLNWQT